MLMRAVKKALDVLYVALRYDFIRTLRNSNAHIAIPDMALMIARDAAGHPMRRAGRVEAPAAVDWPVAAGGGDDLAMPSPAEVFAAVARVAEHVGGTDWSEAWASVQG